MATASQISTTNLKEEIVVSYLQEQVNKGNRYFKSRFIADDIELSSKEVGAVMAKLQQQSDRLDVEKWSSASVATWRVTLSEMTS